MYKIKLLIAILLFVAGCGHHMQPDNAQSTDKIDARILVYLSDNLKNYQSDAAAVIRTLSFKFNEPVTKFLPAFFDDTFVNVEFTDTKADIGDDYDFLAVPKFDSVSFDSDRIFGHELRVNVSIIFTPADNSDPIMVKGTGLGKDPYSGRAIYEQDLANQGFVDALKDLKTNIQKRRSDFENRT